MVHKTSLKICHSILESRLRAKIGEQSGKAVVVAEQFEFGEIIQDRIVNEITVPH